MFKRKYIALDKSLSDILTEEEKLDFLMGCCFYEEYTKEGKRPISKKRIATMPDDEISLLIRTIFNSNLDLVNDKVVSKTLKRLGDEALIRDPREDIDVEEKWREFQEKFGYLFEHKTEVEK